MGTCHGRVAGAFVVSLMAAHATAADLYWDVNGSTAFGDGSKNWSQSATTTNNPNWSTSASGTVTTTNYNPANSTKQSLQFGFGSLADGNLTTAGTINVGNTSNPAANNPYAGVLIFNASGTSGYTIQNQPNNSGPTITLNSGSGGFAGYGIIVNANATGDTSFIANTASNPAATLNLALAANQTWQNNSPAYGLYVNVPVTGAFALTTTGSGLISLGGANAFSGGLAVTGGTTRLASTGAASSGAVSVASGATLDVRAAVTKNVSGAGTISIGPGGNLTASSLGAGVLTIAGVSGSTATFTDSLASGTLGVGPLGMAGSATIAMPVAGSILSAGAVTLSGVDNVLSLSGVAAAGNTYTLLQGTSLAATGSVSLTGPAVGNQTIALGSSVTVGRTTYSFTSTANALNLVTTGSQASLTWTGAANNMWDYASNNWTTGTGSTYFASGDNGSITSAAAITVRPEGVVADALTVSNASGTASLTGGSVTATTLVKSNAGGFAFDNAISAATVTIGAGSLTVNGTGSLTATTLANNGALVYAASGSRTLAAAMSGTGSLSYSGSGTLSLTGPNSFNGNVSIAAGSTLQLAGAGTLGSGSATGAIANDGVLDLATASTQTLGGVISGAGAVTKSGTATATLAGANTYAGSTTVSAGTLKLGSGSALGTADGSTAVGAGAVLDLNGQSIAGESLSLAGTGIATSGALINSSTTAATWSGQVTLSGTGVGVGGAGSTTITGNIVGSAGLAKYGEGVVTLAGVNSFAGGLNILTGTVQVLNQGALPSGNLTWSNSSSSAGLDLVAAGTYAMNSMTMGSILRVGTSGTGNVTLTIASDSTLGGSATKTLQANKNAAIVVNGRIDLTPTSGTGRNLQFQGAGDVSLNGMVFGGGTVPLGIVKNANSAENGTLYLNTANYYNGVTQINGGTVKIGDPLALGSAAAGTTLSAPLYSGGTLDLNGQAVVDESLSMNGTTADAVDAGVYLVNSSPTAASWSGGVTLTAGTSGIGGLGDIAITGSMTGAGTLRKVGADTVTLTNAATTGATLVDQGTLVLGAGSVVAAGGGIRVESGATLSVLGSASGLVTNGGTIAVGPGGRLTSSAFGGGDTPRGAFILSGSAGSPATLTDTAASGLTNRVASVTLGGNSQIDLVVGSTITAGGPVTISGAANVLSLSGVAAKGTTYTLLSGSSLLNTGAIAATGSLLGNQTVSLGSSTTVGRSTYSFTASGTALLLGVTGSQYNLTWTGSVNSTWNYTTVNWQSGGTGYTFDPGDNATIASAATITVDSAGVAADTTTVGNAAGVVSIDGGTLSTNTLVKSGAGLFSANGNVAVATGITLSGGTFQIGAAGSLNGGSYSGPIANNAAFAYAGSGNQTLAGAMSGTGSLTQAGSGTLSLTGTSTSTGSIGIAAGSTLRISDGGVLGSGTFVGSITNDGGLVVSSTVSQTLAGTISGSGALTIQTGTVAPAQITLSGNNAYSGATAVVSGTLRLGSATALGSAAAGTTVSAGGVLDLNGQSGVAEPLSLSASGIGSSGALVNSTTTAAASVSGAVTLNDASTGIGGAGATSLTGLVTGTGGLTKWGEGTVTLSGTVNYAGGTNIQAGTLRVQGPAQLVSGTLQSSNSESSSALDMASSGTYATTTLLVGQHFRIGTSGTGPVTLTAAGGAMIGNLSKLLETGSATTIVVNGPFDLRNTGTATRDLITGGAGNNVFNGTISGTSTANPALLFGIAVGGSNAFPVGTTALNAANTYNGPTTVFAGTLRLGNAQALGSTSAGTLVTTSTFAPGQDGGTLDLNGQTISGEPLTLNGAAGRVTVVNGNAGAAASWSTGITAGGTVTIGGAGTITFPGNLSGSGSLSKAGAGTLALSTANSYAGVVTIDGGTLALGAAGSIAAVPSVTVAAGATFDVSAVAGGFPVASGQTLAGAGTVAGAATVGSAATLAPGVTVGTLTVTQGLTWGAGGNYNWQMLSATGSAGATNSWDLAGVGGTLTIASTPASPFAINLWTLSGIGSSGSAANFNPSQNYTWKIASAAGGISGFAANKFAIRTSATNGTGGFANTLSGGTFSLAQSGNDLNLVFTAGTPTVITINVASGTQTQSQAGYPLLSGSTPVQKTGAGTVVMNAANTVTGSTTVQQGTLQLANAAALASSRVTPVAGGTVTLAPYLQTAIAGLNPNAGGLVDVGNGMVVVAGGLTVPDMLTAITAGYDGGTWTGTTGITSSTAAADTAGGAPRAIGWLDNGDGSVTFAFAAPGDTNLDGLIDVLDAAALSSAARFNDTAVWSEGDFNYDGIYDDLDNALFVSTGLFDAGPYNAPPEAAGAIAAVPEPATWTLVAGGVAFVVCRAVRRRR